MLTLSANVFSDENQDILTSSRVNIAIEDARLYLALNAVSFDLITSGYTSFQNTPSFFTSGFYKACHTRLSSQGVMTQMLPLSGINKQEFRSLVRACIDVFPEVSLWYLSPGKAILLARKKRQKTDYCSVNQRFDQIDHFGRYSKTGIASTELLLGRRLMDDRQLRIFAEGAPVNSDDRPYLEFTRTPADYTDPELIKQLVRDMNKSGNPYFSDINCVFDNAEVRRKIDETKKASGEELLGETGMNRN